MSVHKVGIIGLGKMGQLRKRFLAERDDMKVVSATDIHIDQLPDWRDVTFHANFEEMVTSDIDIVFVCAYNHIAPMIVVKALEAGKHVFCEKPPGRTVADVELIRRTEAAHPAQVLKFGFNHRWHYAIMEAQKMIESGRFGEVLWVRGVYGKSGSTHFEKDWRNDPGLSGGGILIDQGIHMLDLFRLFLGEFVQIQSTVTTSFWEVPVEDNAFAILETTHGKVAMLHSSATLWKHRFMMEICLEHGYIHVNGILSSTRSYGDESLSFARRQLENEARALGKPREETIFFDRDDSWALEINEFAHAIDGHGSIEHGTSLDALRSMELVHEIYEKGRRRGC